MPLVLTNANTMSISDNLLGVCSYFYKHFNA